MASTYLTRTLGSGDTQEWTISFWTKKMMASGSLLSVGTSGNYDQIYFNADKFAYYSATGGSDDFFIYSEQVFRDSSAWYHIVLAIDTTQATSSNRAKLYVNGEQVTTFDGSNVYPSQNFNVRINSSSQHNIGNRIYSSDFNFDGSMAHVHFIDGTAYDASAFGETDATTGIWKPKTAPSVTYGTNGFFLKFENSAAFGTDSSGNDNTFTVNGTMTQTVDTPSNVFAVANHNMKSTSDVVLSNGGLTVTSTYASGWQYAGSTLAVSSGKYYWEAKATVVSASDKTFIGVGQFETAEVNFVGVLNLGLSNGLTGHGAGVGGYSYVQGDIIMCAMDLDNNKVYWGKNGTYFGTLDPTAGTGATTQTINNNNFCMPMVGGYGGSKWDLNFGNGFFGTTAVASAQSPSDGIGIFEYSVPTGYKALCTKSINAQEYS
jgi:hypothetical protein